MGIWRRYMYTKGRIFELDRKEVLLRKEVSDDVDKFLEPIEFYSRDELDFNIAKWEADGWRVIQTVYDAEESEDDNED